MPSRNVCACLAAACFASVSFAPPDADAQNCPPFWQDVAGGISGDVVSLPRVPVFASFDSDGPAGPLQRELFVGGNFLTGGSVQARNLARWNGFGWTTAGAVQSIFPEGAIFDFQVGPGLGINAGKTVLYAAGSITAIDGKPINLVGQWNGSQWDALAPLSGIVMFGVGMHDPDGAGGPEQPILVAVGQRRQVINGPANPVAFWDGISWSVPPQPSATTAFWDAESIDPDGPGPLPPTLFVTTDSVSVGVHEWTGSGWIQHVGISGRRFLKFDPDGAGPQIPVLVVSGGGVSMMGADKTWTPLHFPARFGAVRALASFDPDGAGPSNPLLVAGGQEGVFAWDGSTWTVMGRSTGASGVWAVIQFDDDGLGPRNPKLFVGGEFFGFEGVQTPSLVAFGCNPPIAPCIGDANRDLMVNFSDVTAVVSDWASHNSMADTDQDGVVGMRDIMSVVFSWGADCRPAAVTRTTPITSPLNASDVNGDGRIDFSDITARLVNYPGISK